MELVSSVEQNSTFRYQRGQIVVQTLSCLWEESTIIKFLSFFVFRQTPFAVGPEDSATVILSRIGEGKYSLVGGAWDSISDYAKVTVTSLGSTISIKILHTFTFWDRIQSAITDLKVLT